MRYHSVLQGLVSGWVVLGVLASAPAAEKYQDRFVWIFGWNLSRDTDVPEIEKVLQQASKSGYNGAVVAFGLDALCKKSEDYFRRLQAVQAACKQLQIELIPTTFSIGYGGGILQHNRYLAEGLPVRDALFVAEGKTARHLPDPPVSLRNPGFEEFRGHQAAGWKFFDQPGEVTFIDTQTVRSGKASVRLQNFRPPHGHGRVVQDLQVQPYRCYKLSFWIKTENLRPASAFTVRILARKGEQLYDLLHAQFPVKPTMDWTKMIRTFNSLQFDKLAVYAGVWEGREGRFWLDDFSLEEMGPINVLRRPGTPVVVRSDDGKTTYQEGQDYLPLEDPHYTPFWLDRGGPELRLTPNSRIKPGQRLRVSWYHPHQIYDGQITVCMAEPELEKIFDHEAALLAKYLRPKKAVLSMDEVRMGGTCAACQGKNMAELLGQCVRQQVEALRRHNPGIELYIWSDMLDPHHNARKDYYLVAGDFTGSWRHVPKDLIIAVWGGQARPESLRFFANEGFRTLIACYYDAADLADVRAWQKATEGLPGVRGFMYTTWEKKYDLVPEFGRLLFGPDRKN
ncbi:MAG: carbohydrate binding domain-containing protein [Thermoguttaceae bacterium]|nr:carbohydrate binding domain-containing protein [Thermoguttaceae bacterium]